MTNGSIGSVFGPDGLVPVVAQERQNGDVLMLAWANREALGLTLSSGQAHYLEPEPAGPVAEG